MYPKICPPKNIILIFNFILKKKLYLKLYIFIKNKHNEKIVAIFFFVFSGSITVFCQTTAKELTSAKQVTYSKENFIGHFVTKENVHLKIDKNGSYTWGESSGEWALTIKNGVFGVKFEDNYGEVAEGTITFINKDKFTLLTKEYGTETYTRKK